MNYLIENWFLIIGLLALLGMVISVVNGYIKLPTNKQLDKVKEWLLFIVIEAERQLGTGTGKIKLRFCYDAFIVRFKWISRLITFEMFSVLVDEALQEMRDMLANSTAVSQYVKGK